MATLGLAAHGRLIIAHLGNGVSLAAEHNGQPLDTSMGFTPSGGRSWPAVSKRVSMLSVKTATRALLVAEVCSLRADETSA